MDIIENKLPIVETELTPMQVIEVELEQEQSLDAEIKENVSLISKDYLEIYQKQIDAFGERVKNAEKNSIDANNQSALAESVSSQANEKVDLAVEKVVDAIDKVDNAVETSREANENSIEASNIANEALSSAENANKVAQDANEIANRALEKITKNVGTAVFVNEKMVETFDADTKVDKEMLENLVPSSRKINGKSLNKDVEIFIPTKISELENDVKPDNELSLTSENAVQNKVIAQQFNYYVSKSDINQLTPIMTNPSTFINESSTSTSINDRSEIMYYNASGDIESQTIDVGGTITFLKDKLNVTKVGNKQININVKDDIEFNTVQSTLKGYDNRNTNENPSYYMSNGAATLKIEFKNSTSLGLSSNTFRNNYGVLSTWTPWTDESGNTPFQLLLGGDSNNISSLYVRSGIGNSSWNGWMKVMAGFPRYETQFSIDSGYVAAYDGWVWGCTPSSSKTEGRISINGTEAAYTRNTDSGWGAIRQFICCIAKKGDTITYNGLNYIRFAPMFK